MLMATVTPERAVVGKKDAREKEGGWPLPQQLECGFRSIPPQHPASSASSHRGGQGCPVLEPGPSPHQAG